MHASRLSTLYAALLLALLASLARAAAPSAPAGWELHGDPARGKTVYLAHCALCHGASGDGKGKLQGDPRPADFTDPARMAKLSDWEVYLVSRDGGPVLGLSPKMFGWGKLVPDQDLRDAVAYVRSLAAKR
jgi:high-affinity iron transporter